MYPKALVLAVTLAICCAKSDIVAEDNVYKTSTIRGKTCDSAGGQCLLKQNVNEECNGSVDKKYKCAERRTVCCIPDVIQIMAQRQGFMFQSMQANPSEANTDMEMQLQNVQEHLTNVNSNLANLTEANTHQERQFQNMQEHLTNFNSKLDNLTEANTHQEMQFQNVQDHLTDVNSKLDSQEIQFQIMQDLLTDVYSKLDNLTEPNNDIVQHIVALEEVDFGTIGGTAVATSEYSSSHSAERGFAQPGVTWHTAGGVSLPQSIWYEFPQPLRVVKYSFQCRTDGHLHECPGRGPSRYEFWGSNSANCDNSETRVTLVEDNSDTPFTAENIPKVMHVMNSHDYRCYGFTVTAVPNSEYTCMSNIRFFYPSENLN